MSPTIEFEVCGATPYTSNVHDLFGYLESSLITLSNRVFVATPDMFDALWIFQNTLLSVVSGARLDATYGYFDTTFIG